MRSKRRSTIKKRKRNRRISPLPSRDLTPHRISPRNRNVTPPSVSNSSCTDDLPPFSTEDLLQISIVKHSLRDYYAIPNGKEDASLLNLNQINMIRSSIYRFNDLDFSFCDDDFLWQNVIVMRASRQESSLSSDDIPFSVKASYSKLR